MSLHVYWLSCSMCNVRCLSMELFQFVYTCNIALILFLKCDVTKLGSLLVTQCHTSSIPSASLNMWRNLWIPPNLNLPGQNHLKRILLFSSLRKTWLSLYIFYSFPTLNVMLGPFFWRYMILISCTQGLILSLLRYLQFPLFHSVACNNILAFHYKCMLLPQVRVKKKLPSLMNKASYVKLDVVYFNSSDE